MNIRHILRESVRQILNEQTAEQRVNKKMSENNGAYRKAVEFFKELRSWDDNMAIEHLIQLLAYFNVADGSVSPYADWIVRNIRAIYRDVNLSLDAVETFDEYKKRLPSMGYSPNINDYNIEDLIALAEKLGSSSNSVSLRNALQQLNGQFEVVFESDYTVIVKVLTWDANRFFGSRTSWCTVSNEFYFNKYAPYYFISIPKNDDGQWDINSNDRCQFHLNYNERYDETEYYFCDVEDNKSDSLVLKYDDEEAVEVAYKLCDGMYRDEMAFYAEKQRIADEKFQKIAQQLVGVFNVELEDRTLNMCGSTDSDELDSYLHVHSSYLEMSHHYNGDPYEEGEEDTLDYDLKVFSKFVSESVEFARTHEGCKLVMDADCEICLYQISESGREELIYSFSLSNTY